MNQRPLCNKCEKNGAILITGIGMLCGECYNEINPPINLARSKMQVKTG